MSERIVFEDEGMQAASLDFSTCASEMEQLCSKLCACAQNVQGSMAGQTIESMCSYFLDTAIPAMAKTSEMCYETSKAIDATRRNFTEADRTLSSTFNV